MAIEIYDKAEIIKKNNKFYYFVKFGSKNCFTCAFQMIVDDNFEDKFLRGQSRNSNWHLVAIGNAPAVKSDLIANTCWNCPTSYIYGRIKFGNKKNIALYFVKRKNKILDYALLSDMQQTNINHTIDYYVKELKGQYTIDLQNIKIKDAKADIADYCGDTYRMKNNFVEYNDKQYWDLDNL